MPKGRQGISPSDLLSVETIFTDNGWPLDKIVFHYNEASDTWEAYEYTAMTKRADSGPDRVSWQKSP